MSIEPDQFGGDSGLDRAAIDLAYRDYASQCHAVALRIVRDAELAHDVVQEVFESLVRAPGRFDPERGRLLPWLLVVTHHKAVDQVRWRQRHTKLDTADQGLAELVDDSASTEDATYRDLERDTVVGALQQLDLAEREVIVLAHYGGYSQTEIAAITGAPLGTVKTRTRAAIHRLRGQLRELGGPPGLYAADQG